MGPVALGGLPLVSLVLALSFGLYGIVRKRVAADAQTGFMIECLVVGLPGLAYVLWLANAGHSHFGADTTTTVWLIAAGPITAVPLVLFAWAARRIPLSAMGFLQFLSPSISFVIGLMEGEAFTPAHLQPTPTAAVFERVLRNLAGSYNREGDPPRLFRALTFLAVTRMD